MRFYNFSRRGAEDAELINFSVFSYKPLVGSLRDVLFICVILLSLSFFSCAQEKTSSVLFQGIDETSVIRSASNEESADSILLSKSKEVLYRLNNPINVPSGYSLEVSYSFSLPETESYQAAEQMLADWEDTSYVEISFDENQDAWILPVSLRAIGMNSRESFSEIISYTIPLQEGSINSFSISIVKENSHSSREHISFNLESLRLVPKWFGLVQDEDRLRFTPFVYLDDSSGANIATINPPEKFRLDYPELNTPVFYDTNAGRNTQQSYSIEVTDEENCFVVLQSSQNRAFPLEPITVSPGDAVSFDRNNWRRKNFEVFRWNQFSSILIFDTADYAVQDCLVKRLAFFVEKAGFEGRLSTDEEIAHLHGWNAHDYRAEDLARFFETARSSNFPLNDEELELKQILLDEKIILQNDDASIVPGVGAIVSISRESAEYLRYLFIVHESYHGLYFIDKEFEDFCRSRWGRLHPAAKYFITEYFASQRYDTNNEYLMANELMAYCLQQTVGMAGNYFGTSLAGRIYANPARNHVLPERDEASDSWPLLADLFTEEAAAFSDYVNMRWGLRAGTLRQ
jgi:hypothetical protein